MDDQAIPNSVVVPRELFDWLIEYAIDLRGEWRWKEGETRNGNDQQFADLTQRIGQAVLLRDEE